MKAKSKTMNSFPFLLSTFLLLLAAFPACFEWSPKDDEESDEDDSDDDSSDDDDNATEETWSDSSSGLTWQVTSSDDSMPFDDAKSYCNNLSLDGGGWHLPTISELRSLIRGCDTTETGGSCGVTDSCLNSSCQDASCYEYSSGGDQTDGCYWPSQLGGECWYYLSSSAVTDLDDFTWIVDFGNGLVGYQFVSLGFYVRCVR
jgi:Protein of unknown function (DUF1566)